MGICSRKKSVFGIKKDILLNEKNNEKNIVVKNEKDIIEENIKKDNILKENNMRREVQGNNKKK